MVLSSSDLPEEVQKFVKKNSVKKIIYHIKTITVKANYVMEMYENENDILKAYIGYIRYEIFLLTRTINNKFHNPTFFSSKKKNG